MKKFNIKESFRKGVKNKRLRHGSYSCLLYTSMERGVKIGADVPYCVMRGTALAEEMCIRDRRGSTAVSHISLVLQCLFTGGQCAVHIQH